MHTFLKEAKWKQNDLRQDSQTGLPTEYFALCSEHFEASFQQKFAYWDTSRFQKVWETFSTNNRREGEDSLDTDYPRNEGRPANRFFPRNVLWTFLWDPTEKRQYPTPPPRPAPPKWKNDFFSNWIGLFEICFRSSKMTDPRPSPTGWAYFEIYPVQRRHAKLKPTTNYQLQKSIFLKGQRNISEQNTSSSNVYRTFFWKKNWFVWHLP